MRNLRNAILRRRPLPPAKAQAGADEPEQVPDTFDLEALRVKLHNPEDTQDLALGEHALTSHSEETGPAKLAADPTPKKQIWDIEEDGQEEDPVRPPQKPLRCATAGEVVGETSATRLRTGLDRTVGADTAVSAAERVKTRIIGFHAGGVENDVFAREQSARSASGQFPAGWVVVVDGPGRGASFTIGAGVSTIGRGVGQTVCLNFGDTSISRENHASIAYDDEQNRFFIGHGGKSNIVRRNGDAVLSTEDLVDADLIRIGKTTLRFVALCGPNFTWGSSEDRQDINAPDS